MQMSGAFLEIGELQMPTVSGTSRLLHQILLDRADGIIHRLTRLGEHDIGKSSDTILFRVTKALSGPPALGLVGSAEEKLISNILTFCRACSLLSYLKPLYLVHVRWSFI